MKPFLPVLVCQKIGTAPKHSHLKKEWTSVEKLEKTLVWLVRRGYTFITPRELSKELPAKPVLLVFAGGYESVYTHGLPLLKKYNLCATVCLAQEPLGTYNQWQDPHQEPWQNLLTQSQLDALRKSGRVQWGTLGLTGENLLACQNPQTAREALLESVFRFEKLHKLPVCAVCFWPGKKDKDLVRTREICAGLHLPIITAVYGKNAREEKQFFRIQKPGLGVRFLLGCHNAHP